MTPWIFLVNPHYKSENTSKYVSYEFTFDPHKYLQNICKNFLDKSIEEDIKIYKLYIETDTTQFLNILNKYFGRIPLSIYQDKNKLYFYSEYMTLIEPYIKTIIHNINNKFNVIPFTNTLFSLIMFNTSFNNKYSINDFLIKNDEIVLTSEENIPNLTKLVENGRMLIQKKYSKEEVFND